MMRYVVFVSVLVIDVNLVLSVCVIGVDDVVSSLLSIMVGDMFGLVLMMMVWLFCFLYWCMVFVLLILMKFVNMLKLWYFWVWLYMIFVSCDMFVWMCGIVLIVVWLVYVDSVLDIMCSYFVGLVVYLLFSIVDMVLMLMCDRCESYECVFLILVSCVMMVVVLVWFVLL